MVDKNTRKALRRWISSQGLTTHYSSGESFDICTKVTNYDKLVEGLISLTLDLLAMHANSTACAVYWWHGTGVRNNSCLA